MNLVKHSAPSPSISTAIASSYPPPPQSLSPTYSTYAENANGQTARCLMNNYYGGIQTYQSACGYPPYYPEGGYIPPSMPPAASNAGGMFTRNLVGSLTASAFRLTGPDDKIGVWFILQDLSVRTEGVFQYILSSYLLLISRLTP